jgi:ATP-dependent DNA helicase RecG
MSLYLQSPINDHPALNATKVQSLQKDFGIFTVADLLSHYPFRYVDKSKFYSTREVTEDTQYIQLKGQIHSIKSIGIGPKARLSAMLKDEAGEIELVWFKGVQFIQKSILPNQVYIVFGKPQRFGNKYSIAHPEMKIFKDEAMSELKGFQPLYFSTEGLKRKYLDSKGIHKLILEAMRLMDAKEWIDFLPQHIRQKYNLIDRKNALDIIHNPAQTAHIELAQHRLKFDELFLIQLNLLKLKILRLKHYRGFLFEKIDGVFDTFYKNNLPYELTNAQKRVLKDIRKDTLSNKQMNRLLQGDVGSGKTIVGLMSMLMAVDNGFQACILAPTEILANQHLIGIKELIGDMHVRVEILTGSTKAKVRKVLFADLEEGKVDILIGTHAILEDKVIFKNLGIAIVDEQHKFGVAQRAKLWRKNTSPPHILVMTATPIPRTLAMTLYGDLDYSVIEELPPGRKPIETSHKYNEQYLSVHKFMKEEIALGRQVYVVYPLINESEALDFKALNEGYEMLLQDFPMPDYQIAVVHGKLKPEEKEYEMQRFVKREAQILMSTTVIEVGVNVPNASVMVIESAERFGLSQLHQLRGRVGRGAEKSYCILMTKYELSKDGRARIKIMCDTSNGFVIAEEDLKLRGPGDIQGTQQSGDVELKMANLATDSEILHLARSAASELMNEDGDLESTQNQCLKNFLVNHSKYRKGWGRVG